VGSVAGRIRRMEARERANWSSTLSPAEPVIRRVSSANEVDERRPPAGLAFIRRDPHRVRRDGSGDRRSPSRGVKSGLSRRLTMRVERSTRTRPGIATRWLGPPSGPPPAGSRLVNGVVITVARETGSQASVRAIGSSSGPPSIESLVGAQADRSAGGPVKPGLLDAPQSLRVGAPIRLAPST